MIPLGLDMLPNLFFKGGLRGGTGSTCPGLLPLERMIEYTWHIVAGLFDNKDGLAVICVFDASAS